MLVCVRLAFVAQNQWALRLFTLGTSALVVSATLLMYSIFYFDHNDIVSCVIYVVIGILTVVVPQGLGKLYPVDRTSNRKAFLTALQEAHVSAVTNAGRSLYGEGGGTGVSAGSPGGGTFERGGARYGSGGGPHDPIGGGNSGAAPGLQRRPSPSGRVPGGQEQGPWADPSPYGLGARDPGGGEGRGGGDVDRAWVGDGDSSRGGGGGRRGVGPSAAPGVPSLSPSWPGDGRQGHGARARERCTCEEAGQPRGRLGSGPCGRCGALGPGNGRTPPPVAAAPSRVRGELHPLYRGDNSVSARALHIELSGAARAREGAYEGTTGYNVV